MAANVLKMIDGSMKYLAILQGDGSFQDAAKKQANGLATLIKAKLQGPAELAAVAVAIQRFPEQAGRQMLLDICNEQAAQQPREPFLASIYAAVSASRRHVWLAAVSAFVWLSRALLDWLAAKSVCGEEPSRLEKLLPGDGWCCGHTTLIRSAHGHMHFITVPNDAVPRPRFGEATAAVVDAAEILSIEERACGSAVVSDVLMCSSASFACAVELCLAHTATSLEGLELRTQPTEPPNAPWVKVEQTKFVLASDGGGRSYGVALVDHFSRFVIVQLVAAAAVVVGAAAAARGQRPPEPSRLDDALLVQLPAGPAAAAGDHEWDIFLSHTCA